jgi:acetyl-CoA carboxylase/biotin carboxylase 1
VYDFPRLLALAMESIWRHSGQPQPSAPLVQLTELDLVGGVLVPTTRKIGTNRVAMVVWDVLLLAPEYPSGRPLLIIANDITVQSGSFGPAEVRAYPISLNQD